MILTCPICSTRYAVDANSIPPEGREVRCARCGHTWYQEPQADDPDPSIFEGEPAQTAPEPPPDLMPDLSPDVSTDLAAELMAMPDMQDLAPAMDPDTETVADIRRDVDSEAEAAIARRQQRLREAGLIADTPDDAPNRPPTLWQMALARTILGIGWLGLIGLVLAVGWAALIYRPLLIQYWPQSATLYDAVGIKPDIAALKFASVAYRTAEEDGQPVLLVTGTLANDGAKEMVVPPVRVALLDAGRRELYHWTFSPSALTLAPGRTARFTTRVANPPASTRQLELHFVKTSDQP
jgi:predicted Zn finger-like uncharacterized protein